MTSREASYVALSAWAAVLIAACNAGSGPRLDARPDADAVEETGCDANGCAEICRARGHCGSACEAGGACTCWGDRCVDASGDADDGDLRDVGSDAPDAEEWTSDCPPPLPPEPGCATPGTDPLPWEVAVGDSWCFSPTVEDLSSRWETPAPGCERITYDWLCMPAETDFACYDVWDGFVAAGSRGIYLVDPTCRTREILEPWPSVEYRHYSGSYVPLTHYYVVISGTGVAYSSNHAHDGPCTGSMVWYDRVARRKSLVYYRVGRVDDHDACMDDFRVQLDASAAKVLLKHNATTYCDNQGRVLDGLTAEDVDLTTPLAGRDICIWGGQMWNDWAVFDVFHGAEVLLVDVNRPEPRLFVPRPSYQFMSAIYENTVCWTDLEGAEGSPADIWFGGAVYCAEIGVEEPYKVSLDEPGFTPMRPTIFGEWIAWQLRGPDGRLVDVVVLNRRSGTRFHLSERTGTWGLSRDRIGFPKLWGDWLYFESSAPSDPGETQAVYRCDLRVLAPEAYGASPPSS